MVLEWIWFRVRTQNDDDDDDYDDDDDFPSASPPLSNAQTDNTVSTRPNIGRINTEDEEPPNDNAILVLTDIPTLPPTSQATVQVGGFTLPPKSSPEESTSPNTGPVNPEGEEPHQDNTTIVLLPPILQAVVDKDDHIVTIISDNNNSDIGRTVDGSGSTIQPQPPSVKLPSFNTWQKNKQSTSGTTVLLRGTGCGNPSSCRLSRHTTTGGRAYSSF